MTSILAINGSYRKGGVTDQAVGAMSEALRAAGADVEIVFLREYPIEFCKNCRECTQPPGNVPGVCVQKDGMQELIDKIEKSDGFILAAPTNFGSVSAVFKRFMERLVCYAYWPWGKAAPRYRKKEVPPKKAVLVSSCAAPGIIGRLFYTSGKDLKAAAKTIGAKPVGIAFTGLAAGVPGYRLSEREQAKARAMALKLLKG